MEQWEKIWLAIRGRVLVILVRQVVPALLAGAAAILADAGLLDGQLAEQVARVLSGS